MKALTPLPIIAPGSNGLITEAESREVGAKWAVRAQNAIITRAGLLGSRKGWTALTETPVGGAKEQVFEYVESGGTTRLISAGDLKLYEGTTALTDITGTVTTPTANNWQFINFNGKVLGFQVDHDPIVKSGAGDFADISVSGMGTLPQSDVALAAFGRVWSTNGNGTVLRYSDLLDETTWDDSGTPGSAGLVDLHTVWPVGTDRVVALAEFFNYLVIFGRRSILLYQGAEEPSTMGLADQIWGLGCLARDSVVSTGDDILFLSDEGVISFARAMEAGGLPLTNMSSHNRTRLKLFVDSESATQIRGTYNATEGFYLLSFPTSDRVFCFDLRSRLQDGSSRTTEWQQITPTALYSGVDGSLYLGQDGVIGKYQGARDNGDSYEFNATLGLSSGQGQLRSVLKILKRGVINVFGGEGQTLTFRWTFDFGLSADSAQATADAGDVSEYNIAKYNIDEYSGQSGISILRPRMSGTGKTVQLGFRMIIDGSPIQLNRVDLFFKTGKIA